MGELAFDSAVADDFRARLRLQASTDSPLRARPGLDEEEMVIGLLYGEDVAAGVRFVDESGISNLRRLYHGDVPTPVTLDAAGTVAVHGQPLGIAYGEWGAVIVDGQPLTAQELAQGVLDGLEVSVAQEHQARFFADEDEFVAEDPARAEPAYDLGMTWGDGQGGSYRVSWLPETEELYAFNLRTRRVELLASGIDRDEVVRATDQHLTPLFSHQDNLGDLRLAVAGYRPEPTLAVDDGRPQLGSLDEATELEQARPELERPELGL